MPYRIRKVRGRDLYRVINIETGKVFSRGTTKEKAEKQLRLLHMKEKDEGLPPGKVDPFTPM